MITKAGPNYVRMEVKENQVMTGIQFVTDDKGRRTAVLIDLKKQRELWEDFWMVWFPSRAAKRRASLTRSTVQTV
jgi:hypothetical protein